MHVRDISSNNFKYQSLVVYEILEELGITKFNKPILEVWNKTDLLHLTNYEKKQFKNQKNVVLVSAKKIWY